MRRAAVSETCPHCFNEMVELRRFDPRDDRFGSEEGEEFDATDILPGGIGDLISFVFRGAKAVVDFLFGWIWAGAGARKLDRVRKEFPNSLYCVRCGFIRRYR